MKGYLRSMSVWLALALAFGPAPAVPQEPVRPMVDPAINAPYKDPEFESWVRTFERPGREVYDKRQQIVESTGVEPGQTIADVGAGTGLFTLLFAAEVGPQGRVYAVDISEPFIRNILRRASERGFDNVEGVVNDQKSVRLPPNSVDMAFMSDTYHHFEYPQELMASLHRAMRPGGTLVVIDFRKEGATGWVRGHVRADESTVIREIESMGFELLKNEEQLLERNYFLLFQKTA